MKFHSKEKENMYQSLFTLVIFLCFSTNIFSQEVIRLWEQDPLSANNKISQEDLEKEKGWITDIYSTELYIYKATTNKDGKAIIICPGGGYTGLAIDHEGKQFAQWLNNHGITAFVLKYRMPQQRKNIPLEDAQQAIRYVRENAERLGISENKVGIAGFSAGGHLASTASTHYATERINTRPDFSILFYPVITMGEATHNGSKLNLLGNKPSTEDIYRFSNEKQVSVNTPPTILLLSDDDKSVIPENSLSYYNALKNNAVPAAMYIFPEGGHGWGFRKSFRYHEEMTILLAKWLEKL